MKILLWAASFAGSMIAYPLLAQPVGRACMFGGDSETCLTINFQLSTSQPVNASVSDWTDALGKVHQKLVDIINHECDALRPVTNGSCRIVRLNISANFNEPAAGQSGRIMSSASATFDIGQEPKPQPAKP